MKTQPSTKIIAVLLAGVLTCVIHAQAWCADGQVGHWAFQESKQSGNKILNLSGEDHLSVEGEIRFRTERERTAMIVDGEKHDARIPFSEGTRIFPKNAITVESWIAIEKTVEWGGILSAAKDQKGWLLGFRQSNFSFLIATENEGKSELSSTRAPDSLDWGRWYHVVGTYDGSSQHLYVNGKLEDSKGVSGPIAYANQPDLQFGTYVEGSNIFKGRLWFNEAAIFDYALSAEEVNERYEAKKSIAPRKIHVKVGPYLERIDRDTILARWETDSPSPTVLLYGQEIPVKNRVEDPALKTEHEIEIDGIENQKMYHYRIEFNDSNGTTQSTRLHELDSTFDFAPVETRINEDVYSKGDDTEPFGQAAEDIIRNAGFDRGYCVILGVGEGRLAYEIAKRSHLKVICVDPDSERVQAARRKLDESGLYGVRVTVRHIEGDSLPFAPYLANIIASENLLRNEKVPYSPEEVQKILQPDGGIAFLPMNWATHPAIQEVTQLIESTEKTKPQWTVVRRNPLEGAGAWTHQYGDAGNTSNSGDQLVADPLEVLWYGEPGPRPMTDRGTRSPAPLSVKGRLFVQGDRRLFGLDSYNGTILWEREIPDLRRANVPRDCSNKMAKGNHLFVAVRDRLWKIDGQSGRLLNTFPVQSPDGDNEYDWGYIADGGELLIGSSVRHGGLYIGADGEWYDKPNEESYKVTSDNLFALDPETGNVKWTYEKGRIINPTIAVGDGSLFFVETRSPDAIGFRSSRLSGENTFKDQYMVALDAKTGELQWEKPVEFEGGNWVFYLSYYEGVLSVLATTKQFHIHTFDAKTGEPLWEHHNEMRRDHHGGGMQHPVLTRGAIYSDSLAFDIHSGQVVHDNLPERRGCGTMSAGANAIFFRHYYHSVWDLESDERVQYEGLRSGCWLGIIPAGGILLAPESSAGCFCSDPIQTSIAFLPGSLSSEN